MEAALITPLLLMLTLSMIDFGVLFYRVAGALENGVSQATRCGVTGNSSPGLSREDSIKVAMRNATPTLTIPDGAIAFQPPGAWRHHVESQRRAGLTTSESDGALLVVDADPVCQGVVSRRRGHC